MANVQKYTKGNVQGLSIHWDRKTKNHANKDIDITRSYLNYDLCTKEGDSLSRLNERLKEVHCLNRKDVNHCACWVVTLPTELKEKKAAEQRLFFEKTYEFLTNRYGGEKNVISANVHNDETTPHMHFAFVPTMFDVKRGMDKVCAKKIVSRKDLSSFHGDLDVFLKAEIPHVYQGGILNDKTIGIDDVKSLKKHSEAIQEKKETMNKELSVEIKSLELEHEAEIAELKAELEQEKTAYKKKLNEIQKKIKGLEKIERGYNDCYQVNKHLDKFKRNSKRTIFGKMSVDDETFNELKKYVESVASQSADDREENGNLKNKNKELNRTLENKERIINDKIQKIHELTDEITDLKKQKNNSLEVVNVLQSMLKEKGVMNITQVEYDAHLVLHKVENNHRPQKSQICNEWGLKLEKGAETGKFNKNRLKNAFQKLKTWFNDLLQKEQNRNKDRDYGR